MHCELNFQQRIRILGRRPWATPGKEVTLPPDKLRLALRAAVLLIAGMSTMPAAETHELKVWPDGPPGQTADHHLEVQVRTTEHGWRVVSNVTDPTLEVSLPEPGKRTGGAVLILPGGGYSILAVDHEGMEIQDWLNSLGVAGIVLRYRLPNDAIMEDKSVAPLQDAQEAMRIIRRNAEAWGIDPNRIAVLGSSAGGHLAGSLSTLADWKIYDTRDDVSAQPNATILLYPVISMGTEVGHTGSRRNLLGDDPAPELLERFTVEKQVDDTTPPAFIIHAIDDTTVPYQNSVLYMEALRSQGTGVELHLYEAGGHGFGFSGKKGTSTETWPTACEAWLRQHGWLAAPGH